MFYGNGESTFEFACWETESKTWLNLSDITSFKGDEVLGWLGKDEVTEVIKFLLDYRINLSNKRASLVSNQVSLEYP